MQINKKFIGSLVFLAAGVNASSLFAGTMGAASALPYLFPKISLQAGGFWAHQGKRQHINIDGIIGDGFSVDHGSDSNGLVGIGLYWQGLQNDYFDLSYGYNAFYLPHTRVQGKVKQEELFNNLSYSYAVTNWPMYVGAKADVHNHLLEKVSLTIDTGIGLNIINASNFGERDRDNGITIPDRIFKNNTSAAFSAMAGAGLKFNNVFGKSAFECGYRFFYLGQGSFNKENNQVLDRLKTGDSYANAVLCSITV